MISHTQRECWNQHTIHKVLLIHPPSRSSHDPHPIPSYQSSVILNCSSGMGLKLWTSIDRNLNVSSQCGGTSLWIKSGRTESSAATEPVSATHRDKIDIQVTNLPEKSRITTETPFHSASLHPQLAVHRRKGAPSPRLRSTEPPVCIPTAWRRDRSPRALCVAGTPAHAD